MRLQPQPCVTHTHTWQRARAAAVVREADLTTACASAAFSSRGVHNCRWGELSGLLRRPSRGDQDASIPNRQPQLLADILSVAHVPSLLFSKRTTTAVATAICLTIITSGCAAGWDLGLVLWPDPSELTRLCARPLARYSQPLRPRRAVHIGAWTTQKFADLPPLRAHRISCLCFRGDGRAWSSDR
jgi:hypothetical protein